jgi:hypothetical protein
MTDAAAAADSLSDVLDIDRDDLYKRLISTHAAVAVKRKLTDDEVAAVGKLGLPGLRFVNEMKRFYVSGATAAHLLGFVDFDERGVGGIELSYDKLIRGKGGRLLLDVDALNKTISRRRWRKPYARLMRAEELLWSSALQRARYSGSQITRRLIRTMFRNRPNCSGATGQSKSPSNPAQFSNW